MDVTVSFGSYVSQWFGFVSWCASASDPACRPFVAFLALAGASFGALTLLVLGIVGILNSWEREIDIARASAAELKRAEALRAEVQGAPRAEPAVTLGGVAASLVHAEPVLAAAPLRAEALPARAGPAAAFAPGSAL